MPLSRVRVYGAGGKVAGAAMMNLREAVHCPDVVLNNASANGFFVV